MANGMGALPKLGKVGSMRSQIPPIVRAGGGMAATATPQDAVDVAFAQPYVDFIHRPTLGETASQPLSALSGGRFPRVHHP